MPTDLISHNSITEGLIGVFIILGTAIYLLVALGCAFAIAIDAERRALSKWGTFALVLIFFPISAIVWLLIRSRFEETPMFNYASAQILAKQSGRPTPAPSKVSTTTEGAEPEKRKIRIIEEEDYADAGERTHRRRRRSSSRSGSHSARRRTSSNRCRKCGHRLASTVAVCPHCGTKRTSE
jgi:hypothetical protein